MCRLGMERLRPQSKTSLPTDALLAGKKDAKLNTPINSSVSVAMNQDDLCTVTSAASSGGFERDRLWLNGW